MRLSISRTLLILALASALILQLSPTTTPTYAQGTGTVVSEEMLNTFESLVTEQMEHFHVPGMAAAVIAGGEVVYLNGFGLRNVEEALPFTPQTRFRIGSTTKSMTSMLIAQLVEDGLLSWDTPVTDIFPDFRTTDPDLTEQMLVRDLMGMGTGLENDELTSFYWDEATFGDLLDVIADQPVAGPFREHYHYNNEVYALGGYAGVVAHGGEPTLDNYRSLMQERIFDPIGMESAIITDDHSALGDNFAEPYEISLIGEGFEVLRMPDPPIGIASPAGAVWTNMEDMADYLITQISGGVTPDGTRLVDADILAETWQPGVAADLEAPGFSGAAYGMGWVSLNYEGHAIRWHDGGWVGYATQMVVFPEEQVGLLLFANSSFAGTLNFALTIAFADLMYGLNSSITEDLLASFDTMIGQIMEARESLANATVNAEVAAPLVGEYENGWQVAIDGDFLVISRGAWRFRAVPMIPPFGFIIVDGGAAGTILVFQMQGDGITLTMQGGETEIRLNKLN